MAWHKTLFENGKTIYNALVGNNQEEGIEEAKTTASNASATASSALISATNAATEAAAATVLATKAQNLGGTAGITGYVGPLISFSASVEGAEEAGFVAAVEQFGDGCTPEIALKAEQTYAGTTNPGKANISNFLTLYKKIGAKKRWRGHTLIWWSGLAKWMETFAGTTAAFEEQMLAYVTQVVEAVGQRVDCWDVLNELTNAGKLRTCIFTEKIGGSTTIIKTNPVMVFYANCLKAARAANPSAALFVNEYETETLFNYGGGQRGTVFLEFINVLLELGAPIDGVGMQFHTNTQRLVTEKEIEEIVPKYTEKGLAVEFTELDVQIEPGDTEAKQGEVYEAAINGAKKAGVGRVTIWTVTDKRSWLNAIWKAPYKLTSNTAIAATVLNLTEAKAKKLVNGMAVRFKTITAGVTTFNTTTTYFVVGEATNAFELSATEGGAAIKVEGHILEAATTEVEKWVAKGFGPRPAPFGWEGTLEVKPGWRSMERSRPEQPGISEWKSLSLNAKAKAKSVAQTPVARTEGLSIACAGQIEATEELAGSATVATLPVGVRPIAERQVLWTVNGVATFLTVGTNGAISIQSTDKLPAAKVLRLDGLRFPLS